MTGARRVAVVLCCAVVAAWVFAGESPSKTTGQAATKHTASAIQVMAIQSKEVKLPAQFEMALYENLIEQIERSKRFQHVYRDGDETAAGAPDLVTLSSTVWGFQEGSAMKRQVTTVSGKTSIKVNVQVADRQGKVLVNRDVEGKVRFLGENLRATYDFGKKVVAALDENFVAAK